MSDTTQNADKFRSGTLATEGFEGWSDEMEKGEFALHNLENAGNTTMIFTTVELKKESGNEPLPI